MFRQKKCLQSPKLFYSLLNERMKHRRNKETIKHKEFITNLLLSYYFMGTISLWIKKKSKIEKSKTKRQQIKHMQKKSDICGFFESIHSLTPPFLDQRPRDIPHRKHQRSGFNSLANKPSVLTAHFHMTQYPSATLFGLQGLITCAINDGRLSFLTRASPVKLKGGVFRLSLPFSAFPVKAILLYLALCLQPAATP